MSGLCPEEHGNVACIAVIFTKGIRETRLLRPSAVWMAQRERAHRGSHDHGVYSQEALLLYNQGIFTSLRPEKITLD